MREKVYLFRRLKARVPILAVIAVIIAFPAAAQEGNLTLPVMRLNAQTVFENIQRQTSYKVAVNNNRTDNLYIDVTKATLPVRAALERLLDGSDMTYRMDGSFIVITETPLQNNPEVPVSISRNVSGIVTDGNVPLAGITVWFVNLESKQAVTGPDGRFRIESIFSGNHIVRLSSPDGANIRYREVSVHPGGDAEVTLIMGGELMSVASTEAMDNSEAKHAASGVKSTTFFVPRLAGALPADDDDAGYSLTHALRTGNGEYLPKAALKTNILYLGAATPNLSVEFGLARRWTMDIGISMNPWKLNSRGGGIRHGLVRPEFRYWFSERFEKHFIGFNAMYGCYNIGKVDFLTTTFSQHSYKGWAAGAGVSYGYHLPMKKRWSWEFGVGLGYLYLDYTKSGEDFTADKSRHWFGPVRADVTLVFMIK